MLLVFDTELSSPEEFIDHYEANGWMRGNTKIKDWKACVRTWENKRKENSNGNSKAGQSGEEPRSTSEKLSALLRASTAADEAADEGELGTGSVQEV